MDIERAAAPRGAAVWIRSPRWDTLWLTASAVVVPVGLAFIWAGASSLAVNVIVTALVGGPHLFATYLATYLDPRFRREHRWMLAAATILVPAFVVAMTVANFQVLLSVFIFAASLHVLQQNAYLADVYRRRAGRPEPAWSRWVDYGFVGLSFYPIASYRLVHDDFVLGDVPVLIPSFLKFEATYWAISLAFLAFAAAWAAKTYAESRRGALNVPKTVLLGVTGIVAFLVPLATGGGRLELAFQTVNMWHSIQYLALVWIVLKVRKERGLVGSRLLERMSGPGRATVLFYGACFLLTGALAGVVLLLYAARPFSLSFMQYYYMVVLSALLIHYVLDGYLFAVSHVSRASADRIPYAAPSRA